MQDYLNSWLTNGMYVAERDYRVPTQQVASPAPGQPQVTSWKVLGYCPVSWKSAGKFTLYVEMDLQITDPAAWGEGRNDRFVTFTRSTDSASGFRLSFATSP